MESVRRKSLFSAGNQLISRAYERGIPLLWERYEAQLPLDGFAESGLTCHDCLYGPCRINPFGEEPLQGICGADRQQIALQFIFRAAKKGVLESAHQLPFPGSGEKAREALILTNPHFSDKAYLQNSLTNMLKLGSVQYELFELAWKVIQRRNAGQNRPSPKSIDLQAGANIFLEGGASTSLVESLLESFRKEKIDLRLLVGEGSEYLRKWGACVASLGHAELMLLTGGIDGLVMHGNGMGPYLVNLAERLGIEVFRTGVESAGTGSLARSVSKKALEAYRSRVKRGADPFPPSLQLAGEENTNQLQEKAKKVGALLKVRKLRGVAILIGDFNVKQTFFERTSKIIQELLKEDVLVFLGGGLFACQPILENLIESKMGKKLSGLLEELNKSTPLFGFGSACELPGVIEFLSSLDSRKGLRGIRTVAVFPEVHRWSYLSAAFGLLSLGIPVQIGTRLPFWGSPELTDVFFKELKSTCGTEFLVAPSLASAEEQSEEILRRL